MKIRRKLYCRCAFVKYSDVGKPLCIGISSFIVNSAEEIKDVVEQLKSENRKVYYLKIWKSLFFYPCFFNPTFNLSKAVEIINLREGTL